MFECDEYPYPRWLALHETDCANPLNQREASAVSLRLPTKVTVSRKADRTMNEFNISSADSCNLIVTLWNRYYTFKERETKALSWSLSGECLKSLGFF